MTRLCEAEINIATVDGTMRGFTTRSAALDAAPGVVMYMDAVGYREELRELARGLAFQGYSCWLPDLYYRDGGPSFDVHTPKRDLARFTPLMRKLTRDVVLRDTQALLDRMSADPQVVRGPKGCVGFCMGGRLALWAAGAFPGQIAAAASLHGGQLGTDSPESPHRYATQMRCEVYLGFASDDPLVPDAHIQTVEQALREAGIVFESETHQGTQHGYSFPERFCYNRAAARASWDKIFAVFDRNLRHTRATSNV